MTHPEFRSRQIPFQEEMLFQCRSWAAESVALVILCCILFGALFGVFGGAAHIWSRLHVHGVGASASFDRFSRITTLSVIEIIAAPTSNQFHVVGLGSDFSETYDIVSIWPRPLQPSVGMKHNAMSFPGSSDSSIFRFSVKPLKAGLQIVNVSIDGQKLPALRQLVYP
jgi:hypothetical protein